VESLSLATSGNLSIFYVLGFLLIALGIAFVLIPLLASSGALSNVKIPWIVLYVYRSGNFYFATSPILIIISAAALLFYLLRR
jgi:hypothetical protein